MPRTVEVVVPPNRTDAVVKGLMGMHGVVGIALQRGTSLDPPGDVLTLHTTNDASRAVFQALADLKVMDGGAIASSDLSSLVSPPHQAVLNRESNETVWEEIDFLMREQSNLSNNFFALMLLSGAVAAVGFWTDQSTLIYAGQLLAPHVEPLLRIPFGLITGTGGTTKRGIQASVAGYALVALGAALTLLVLRTIIDPNVGADLTTRASVQNYASVVPSNFVVSFIAGAASAFVLSSKRSVLLSGVYIALALLPGMSLVGMALANGNVGLAGQALARWGIDAGAVVIVGGLVLALKQALLHRRRALG